MLALRVLLSLTCVVLTTGCHVSPVSRPVAFRKGASSEWVRIEGGIFLLGGAPPERPDQFPKTQVILPSFEMTRSEITVAQYDECIRRGACQVAHQGPFCNWGIAGRKNHAMNCVDWYQATAFCHWVDGNLPSETQWEYAARSGGADQLYPWGDAPLNCSYAINDASGRRCGGLESVPVCSRPRGNSAQGICDLVGNVYEWMRDLYVPNYLQVPSNGDAVEISNLAPTYEIFRSMRGGGLGSHKDFSVRRRTFHAPQFWYSGLGIRCVRPIP